MNKEEKFFEHGENVKVDAWGQMNFIVVFTEDRKRSIQEQLKLKGIEDKKRLKWYSPGKHSKASFRVVDEKETLLWILSFDINNINDGVIVHEAFHGAHHLLEYVGITLKDSSEESYAYLIEYLFNRIKQVQANAMREYEDYKIGVAEHDEYTEDKE